MATPKWDLTRPPFIDPRVWAVAIKRKKSYWSMGLYLALMTIEPTDADVTLRASNSRMNKDYGVATGLFEAKSLLDVIQRRSDNLGISYEQSRSDVYAAIEWMVCDMPSAYGSPSQNARDPFDRLYDLFTIYPQMPWYFLCQVYLDCMRELSKDALEACEPGIRLTQSVILKNLYNEDFGRPKDVTYTGRNRTYSIDASSVGSASWFVKNGLVLPPSERDLAGDTISSLVDIPWSRSRRFGFLGEDIRYTARSDYEALTLNMISRQPILTFIGMHSLIDHAFFRDADKSEYRRSVDDWTADRFRDFIRRWPPSKAAGDVSRSASAAAWWAAGGMVIGAAAMSLSSKG